LDLKQQMDSAVQSGNLSVGTHIKAMLIQILSDRKAPYHMVELLLGPDITA
jgi:hypothetical protein